MPIFHKCYNMLNQNPKIKKLRQLWRWYCYEIVKIFLVRAARAELAGKWVEVMQFMNRGPVIGYYNSSSICSWQYQWKNSNWCVPWQQWFIWHKNLYQLWKPQPEFIWVMKLTSLLELSLQNKEQTFGASRLECNWNPWTNILQV